MICGMDILLEQHGELLKGRRIGLLSHQAALVATGATSAQALRKRVGQSLGALFGPEHGFMGQALAGEETFSTIHPEWKIPVHSLYGAMRAPSPEMLHGLDLVICDLQDLGVRCYTYLATMANMLRACREAGVAMIVTDRPIPLPLIVDGAMPHPDCLSFVAPCNLPMVYGMTPAETALWLNQDHGGSEMLRVIPMQDWQRSCSVMGGEQGEFMPPSPSIQSRESALAYPVAVFSEALPGIDCGRGTNLAFRVIGAPWLEPEKFCQHLASFKVKGVSFHPYRYTAAVQPLAGQELGAVRISVTEAALFHPIECSLLLLRELAECYGEQRVWQHQGVRSKWFDQLYGDPQVRLQLRQGVALKKIFAGWRDDRSGFMEERQRALLY
ncbi:MAG: DUF1343 domain-containing protein [Kiritimatiellae bacterium]|nr:DUF1343 domain-containing protein [Kiritimatiellia bacterium]